MSTPAWQDPDGWGAASHRNMIAHLTGPFAGGARDSALLPDGLGVVRMTWNAREPLLLAAPSRPLEGEALRLEGVLDPDGTAEPLPPLQFFRYTEAGAFLPLYQPPVDPATRTAAPVTVALSLTAIAPDGTETSVPAAELADRLEVRVVEGNMGKLLYVLGAEKQRVRRQARELAAMRCLATADGGALDLIGADLGVPRFTDEILWDATAGEVVTRARLDSAGVPQAEPDDEYRRRLALYRPLLQPTRSRLLELLNGPGGAADPNRGPIGALGQPRRFDLVEADNEFAVSIHLVGAGGAQFRDNFLLHTRAVRLVRPEDTAAAQAVHDARFIPSARRQQEEALRDRLAAHYTFPAGAALAPMLASALDLAGRCRAALGVATPWQVLRAQDGGAGSRYELGLGVDLRPPMTAHLNQMRSALLDPNRVPSADAEVEELLARMVPALPAEDPEGRWLLEPCGLRTVHRVNTQRLYVSHFPTFGLAITGPSTANPGAGVQLEAHYHAPGDPGTNAALAAGLQAALAEWTASGGAAWTVIPDAQAPARWSAAGPRPAGDPALNLLGAAGLPALREPGPVVERLKRVSPELVETLRLPDPLAQAILAGQVAAGAELRRLVEILQKHHVVSVLPLITGPSEVLLVAGAIGLPEAGTNLSARRATGFRWYAVPLEGPGGEIKAIGSRTVFVPAGAGLTAIVVVGYARRGLTDPYEFRVELPDDARLDLRQYEFLMNLLQHAYPLGVEVNTYAIRQRHVDLDGDGVPEPLSPSVFRTYRQFRRKRHRGETAALLSAEE